MKIHTQVRLSFLIPALALAVTACGGGGGDSDDGGGGNGPSPPPSSSRVTVEVIAGPAVQSASAATAPGVGCTDGAASAVVLGGPTLAIGVDGNSVYTGERGCGSARVRRIDLAAKTVTTVAEGEPVPDSSGGVPTVLSRFATVQAIAQASDGSLLIADTEGFNGSLTLPGWRSQPGVGNGVWRLYPDGRLVQLAGFARPARAPAADGMGEQAVFGVIFTMCPAAQDAFYVYDDAGGLRQLTLDGRVESVRKTNGERLSGLVCGSGGRNMAVDSGGQLIELPSKQPYASLPTGIGAFSGLADATTQAWFHLSTIVTEGRTYLLDLATGRELEGSSIPYADWTQVAQTSSALAGRQFLPAPGGGTYVATELAVLKITYK